MLRHIALGISPIKIEKKTSESSSLSHFLSATVKSMDLAFLRSICE